jgi:hypothetical protein
LERQTEKEIADISICRACEAVIGPEGVACEADVKLPDGVQLHMRDGTVEVIRRWYTPKFRLMALFCLTWNSFLLFWFLFSMVQEDIPDVALIFPVGHVLIGLALAYYTVAGFINRTVLVAGPGGLDLHHEPLPWGRRKHWPAPAIRHIRAKRYRAHGNRSGAGTYALFITFEDGRWRTLLGRLETAQQAWSLECALKLGLGGMENGP